MATGASSSWLSHIKTFVDPDLPAPHQIASRDAILNLINQKALSFPQIVAGMETYLTSSDGAVRARGILLLGELWMLLVEQPLEDTSVHNFATFFSARLEDWHSLHGALVGSLALAKRRKNVGAILNEDAEVLVESALNNLEVQALAQEDRMLCLELFECLLLHHSGAVAYHGVLFADRICEIIDGEKDPRCLLLVFHIVEVAMELFPDPKGHIGRISEDLFGIISCYFPISFNPAPDDKRGITREDLSMALMHCFASTKLFADFCIPLLLEKLSSTLKGAKRDSLKFLGYCITHYGDEVLQKHTAEIWMALKQELMLSHGTGEISPREKDDQILTDAQNCLQACIRAFQAGSLDDIGVVETNSFLQMILQDAFLDDFIACLPNCLVRADNNIVDSMSEGLVGGPSSDMSIVSERAKDKIRETGSVLATAVKASPVSCFAILRTLFQRMFEVMKIGVHIQESEYLDFLRGVPLECTLCLPDYLMVSVLEVIYSLVEGAREVAENFCQSLTESNTPLSVKWMAPVQFYSELIVRSFSLVVISGLQNDVNSKPLLAEKVWGTGVAGLQALGCFPPQVSAISDSQYNFVVSFLEGIILKRSEVISLWNRAVNAIAAICSAEGKFADENQRQRNINSLVCLLLNELSESGKSLSIQCNLKALAIICNERPQALGVALRKLIGMVCDELKKVGHMADVEENAFELAIPLLQGLLHSILPSCESTALSNDTMLELVGEIWSVVESLHTFHNFGSMEELPASYIADNMQMLECSLGIVQVSVSKCDEQSQRILLLKMLDPFICGSPNIVLHLTVQDVWVVGLFASVITVIRPTIQIPQRDDILHRLLTAAVSPSYKIVSDAASEAVGYLLNKWHPNNDKINMTSGVDSAITTAIDGVLKGEWVPTVLDHESGSCDAHTGKEALLLKKKCIHLLACIGRGLAMRGHIAVSDIVVLLLKLVECRSITDMNSCILLKILWPKDEEISAVSFAAAEALGFILKDFKVSVIKQNHLIVKPLYQQRFFVCMLPPIMLALKEADIQERVMLYFAFGNLVAGIPTNVILTESKKVLPLVLESLSTLSGEQQYSSVLLSVLLVLSATLVDKNGGEFSSQHIPAIVNRLLTLISYPHSTMVRETTLLCLGTLVALPYARVFPFRMQVLRALTSALDDPKRAVRKEAVKCRRAWSSIAR